MIEHATEAKVFKTESRPANAVSSRGQPTSTGICRRAGRFTVVYAKSMSSVQRHDESHAGADLARGAVIDARAAHREIDGNIVLHVPDRPGGPRVRIPSLQRRVSCEPDLPMPRLMPFSATRIVGRPATKPSGQPVGIGGYLDMLPTQLQQRGPPMPVAAMHVAGARG